MHKEAFKQHGYQLIDWMADYLANTGEYPVKPNIQPGDIAKQLPAEAPTQAHQLEDIFKDFQEIILPGMTHWQHPQFFAYFPTGVSEASIFAEMLTSAMGAQCMVWATSPAAEELEERMMEWLRDAMGLSKTFTGVIQDSSSSSTLVALLTARVRQSSFKINQRGFQRKDKYRVYTSDQAHSSVDKGVKIAGFGIGNLVKIETNENFAMIPEALEAAILKDKAMGFTPLCVVSTIGTTSSCAIDPIAKITVICQKYECWHHIDASYAGTALLLPEMQWLAKEANGADSFVFNPHKWMFTNFDCSCYYVKDKSALINTFSILPEYLKTPQDHLVNNYRDWGIPLGRRFRALKLWFVIRSMGVWGLQNKIREHIEWGQRLKEMIADTPGFEILSPVHFNLVCFRYIPAGVTDEKAINAFNERLIKSLNQTGKILLTQTNLKGKYTSRFVGGNINTSWEGMMEGWKLIKSYAADLSAL